MRYTASQETAASGADKDFDVFISYVAGESKSYAHALHDALHRRGLRVWFDERELLIGDSIRAAIDAGIARSRSGLLLLSRSFFQRGWPKTELDGLAQRAKTGEAVLLPVLVEIDVEELGRYSPTLAGLRYMRITDGADAIALAVATKLQRGDLSPVMPSIPTSASAGDHGWSWPDADQEFERLRTGAPAIVIRCIPRTPGQGRLQDLERHLGIASRRVSDDHWPWLNQLSSKDFQWRQRGVLVVSLPLGYWAITPGGAFQFGTLRTNWYYMDGQHGFGFQAILYELAHALIFADRMRASQTMTPGQWTVRLELRGAQGQALIADVRQGSYPRSNRCHDDVLHGTTDVALPSSANELERVIANLVEDLVFPFTVDGRSPLPPGGALRALQLVANANRLWDNLSGSTGSTPSLPAS